MYVVDALADEPIMLLNRHIGNDDEDGPGIQGDLFQQELLQLDGMGKKRIQIWINSVGGSVIDGYAIYNAILKSKTKVDTYCVGIAASIAGVIFQAGRKRIMADYGILMYHNPFGGDNSKGLDAMKDSINTMISGKSGMDAKEVERMMNRETFIMADEAVKYGLADEIEISSDFNKKRLVTATNDAAGYFRQAGKILNSILKPNNKMKLVTNKLKLNDDASEQSIVTAITDIQDKLTASDVKNKKTEDEMAKMKNDLDESEEKFKKQKDEYDACKNELTTAQNKLKAADDAAALAKATALVTDFVKIGKVKNEAALIKKWTDKAVADFAGTKDLLDSIPTNMSAPKFPIKTGEQVAKDGVKTAAMAMVEIENRLDQKNKN